MAEKKEQQKQTRQRPPATTPEAREHQLISIAVDLAEKQMKNGTASPSVITHFLKLGSSRDRIEQDNLKEKNKLLKAQTEAIRSEQKIEALYKEALDAMRSYGGGGRIEYDDDYE